MNSQKGLSPIAIIVIIAVFFGGYLIYQNQNRVIPLNQQNTQSPSPSNETTNWKIYTNKDAGYSISYPESWQVENSNTDGLYVFSPNKAKDNQKFYVLIQVEKTDKEPGTWLKGKTIGGVCCPDDARISSPFTVDGKVFYVVLTSQSQYPGIIGQSNGKIYYLSAASGFLDGGKYYYDQTDKALMDNINVADKIMKTFKFLDQNIADINNWKTYTATDNSYSFRYPPQWYIEHPSNLGSLSFFQTGVIPKHSTSGVFGNETLIMIDYSAAKFDDVKSAKDAEGSPASAETTLNGKRSLRSKDLISADILIKHLDNGNDRILNLRITDTKNIQFLDQILATFKFQ